MIKISRLIVVCAAVVAAGFAAVPYAFAAAVAVQSRDLTQEDANRALVLKFYDTVFNAHEVAEGAKVIAAGYIQHNPHVPNGKEPFVSYFADFFEKNPQARARVVRSAAEGELVYLHVHATNGQAGSGQAIVDIFRVRDNMIVEHWDVVQAVPAQSANGNTMF